MEQFQIRNRVEPFESETESNWVGLKPKGSNERIRIMEQFQAKNRRRLQRIQRRVENQQRRTNDTGEKPNP